ncbi:MAG TPA: MFS transporter [bacterium]|jgi:MFS family permease|nr:MFS transporter [Patescibacteria group bacterium]HOC96371.1 MFS transporter [bacterium]HPO11094.1 MFS transporter [bacterium]
MSQKKQSEAPLSLEGVNKVIKVLIYSDILISGGFGLVAPIFAIFIINNIYGATLEVIGISTAIYLITRSLTQLVVSEIIEKIQGEEDDFYFEFIGTIMSSLIYLFFPLIINVPQLYMAEIILGVSSAMTYPSWVAIFSRHADKGEGSREWAIHDILIDVVLSLTAVIGAVVVSNFGFQFIFLIIGTLGMVGSIVLIGMKNDLFKTNKHTKNDKLFELKDVEDYEKDMKKKSLSTIAPKKRGRPKKISS